MQNAACTQNLQLQPLSGKYTELFYSCQNNQNPKNVRFMWLSILSQMFGVFTDSEIKNTSMEKNVLAALEHLKWRWNPDPALECQSSKLHSINSLLMSGSHGNNHWSSLTE